MKTEIEEHNPIQPVQNMLQDCYEDSTRNGCNDENFEPEIKLEKYKIEDDQYDEFSPSATTSDKENVEDIFSTHYCLIPPGQHNSLYEDWMAG